MKKILKGPNDLVRRVLSKSPNLSQSSSAVTPNKDSLMSEEQQIGKEIKSLKDQIEYLKTAINTLQEDTEKKEVAIARIAREKEKITMDLLKQQRSNKNLLQQLEEERTFYYKEKEMYCQEMNQFKKLKQALSNSTTNVAKSELPVECYKKEIDKIKQTLNQTLEANYNLSIKFLRMKNTKTCLKTELKAMQLEHEKLIKDYKTKIHNLSEELNDLIQERLNTPISCSSKKYLHLVKQNSCLVYENLCLQLEVDKLHLKFEKLKLEKTKSETNGRLKYIKHQSVKPKKLFTKEHKKVRIKEERPEKDITNNLPSTSHQQTSSHEEVQKIFERCKLPGVPEIKLLSDFDGPDWQKNRVHIPSVQENTNKALQKHLKKVSEKPSSKLTLFQVSNASSSRLSTASCRSLQRVRSSPEIARPERTDYY